MVYLLTLIIFILFLTSLSAPAATNRVFHNKMELYGKEGNKASVVAKPARQFEVNATDLGGHEETL